MVLLLIQEMTKLLISATMIRILRILLFLFALNILVSCSQDDNIDEDRLTLCGKVISEPNNNPIPEVAVMVKNGNKIVCSTKTNQNGQFTLEVNIAEIDATSKLLIDDLKHGVQKEYEIMGFGKKFYDYGDMILYDYRNPYNLPVFQFNSHIFIVHPLLTGEYSYDESLNICSNLHDYDVDSWFLPTKDELMAYFKSCDNLGEVYSAGYYRISEPSTSVIRIYRLFIDNVFRGYGCDEVNVSPEENAYVLPMAKYE